MSTSSFTRSGRASARDAASSPPIDWPITTRGPWVHRSTNRESMSVIAGSVYVVSGLALPPRPGRSMATTRCRSARGSKMARQVVSDSPNPWRRRIVVSPAPARTVRTGMPPASSHSARCGGGGRGRAAGRRRGAAGAAPTARGVPSSTGGGTADQGDRSARKQATLTGEDQGLRVPPVDTLSLRLEAGYVADRVGRILNETTGVVPREEPDVPVGPHRDPMPVRRDRRIGHHAAGHERGRNRQAVHPLRGDPAPCPPRRSRHPEDENPAGVPLGDQHDVPFRLDVDRLYVVGAVGVADLECLCHGGDPPGQRAGWPGRLRFGNPVQGYEAAVPPVVPGITDVQALPVPAGSPAQRLPINVHRAADHKHSQGRPGRIGEEEGRLATRVVHGPEKTRVTVARHHARALQQPAVLEGPGSPRPRTDLRGRLGNQRGGNQEGQQYRSEAHEPKTGRAPPGGTAAWAASK